MSTLGPDAWRDLERLFGQTETLEADALEEFLETVAEERPDLIAELTRLVAADRAHDPIGGRLRRFTETLLPRTLASGERVDCWAIRRLLGRGGMGAVYLVERDDEVYRQTAVVKVLDAPMADGMAERFSRERQILADLDHPNIARLLDGGSLADGRPYLVMDYVDGCSISRYCEAQKLDLRERVELVRQVGEALQYAHANLVIHRDIKPDNVLVDRTGRVRLLDFGIARLVETTPSSGGAVGSHSVSPAADPARTIHGGAALSPAYASPEQLRGGAITIATDIYSLGALLYRLLTGHSPHDPAAQRDGRRASASALLVEQRRPREARRVRGDLDAVIDRAMAEAPDQRYPSIAALVDDLERWVSDHPVRARRSNWAEQLVKFTRRNRALAASIGTSGLIVAALLAGLIALAVKLDEERTTALEAVDTTEQIADYLVDLFGAADPATHQGETLTARELLDRGVDRIGNQTDLSPAVHARLLHRMAVAYRNLDLFDDAVPLYESALARRVESDDEETWDLRLELADLQRERGEHADAEARLLAAIETLENEGGPAEALASAYNNYGIVLEETERYREAELQAQRALAVADTLPETRQNDIMRTRFRHNLAIALAEQGRYDEAIDVFEEVIEAKTRQLGVRHPSRLRSMQTLGGALRSAGRLTEAAAVFEELLGLLRAVYGDDSISLASLGNEVANLHHDAGRYRDAERAYRDALASVERDPARDPLLHVFLVNNLASLYEDYGDLARAEPLFRRSIRLRQDLAGPEALALIRARVNLARLLIKRGGVDEAEALLDAAQAALAEHHPDNAYRWQVAEVQRALIAATRGEHGVAMDRMADAVAALEALGPMAATGLRRARMDAVRIDLDAGRADRALATIERIERSFPTAFAPDHPKRRILDVLRAQALAALGRIEEARRLASVTAPVLEQQFAEGAEIRRRAEAVLAAAGAG
ncbi:tetratricopeptide repeat protein [Wenzhouxiangella sp. XN79A]|uniref:serine/threonine-protein kinase n=1 Tax=Wenzhouxiangella sp. XN79A TaxID=2724193 RepID=UPI00144AEC35|nr:serine/threonine-protein kinase [Wenzhouxiangella sp. XN79A]NKI35779.1 tetratricopeptide repeat protein [Wenzhouxiangella sp. XN79A]